ncbi:MAG: cobyric acid synthase [Ahrensia sp.]|nr:cobyric acid synthase [Ahrensia sp.]
MALSIMLQGTGSDVGKTVLVAGLCRALKNRGLKVRPFKPQNMSNNAAVADDGGEIGRAQWLQALACGVSPSIHMNPVLLKPQSEVGSQVVVHGKVIGTAKGRDYQKLKPSLLSAVLTSFERLRTEADIVVVEGAGSPAEINLRQGDIANMGFATRAHVPVVLVGDIDRGGVIASLVGTHTILSDEDRAMIIGFIINKFRGDVSLFDDGLLAVTKFTGWPSFGVVPWLKDATRLPAEDSVALENLMRARKSAFKIAVPMLDRISNFDDLDPLIAEPGVEVVMVKPNEALPTDADLVIIPGSKSTISDLIRFRENGWDVQLQAHVQGGGHVLGICGGYQMLGQTIADPSGLEGEPSTIKGLGLLNVSTTMQAEKHVKNVKAKSCKFDLLVSGYEIHIGETAGDDCARPTTMIGDRPDGATSYDGRISGTYLHGYFGSGAFRKAWLASYGVGSDGGDHLDAVSTALDDIANRLEELLDIDGLLAAAENFRPAI